MFKPLAEPLPWRLFLIVVAVIVGGGVRSWWFSGGPGSDYSVSIEELLPAYGPAPHTISVEVRVDGYVRGDITYRFNCDNVGPWAATEVTREREVLFEEICTYEEPGVYAPVVSVQNRGKDIREFGFVVVQE